MARVLVLNGPNLNLLGIREPHLYGTAALEDARVLCESEAKALGMEIDFRQTNHEGVLIDWVHEAHFSFDGIVINAAALARTSLSLHDAVKAITAPVVEIHITNIYQRDSYRPPSFLSKAAHGVICGFGHEVYPLGLRALHGVLAKRAATAKGSERRDA
jgi:3-dehydroquinate dehydratase-2